MKKRRRHSIVAFEMVRLDRAAAEPLHQQLYRQIRADSKKVSDDSIDKQFDFVEWIGSKV